MDTASLRGGQAEWREVREREARAAHHNPLGKFEQPFGLVPARQIEKAVRADQVEEARLGHRVMQRGQRINGVVRGTVFSRSVDVGDGEARIRATGKLDHGEPVGKWSWN